MKVSAKASQKPTISERDELEQVLIGMLRGLPKVVVSRKGHSINFTVGTKVFLFTKAGAAVIKVPETVVDDLVESGTGERLVMGKRTMREWAIIQCDNPDGHKKRLALYKKALKFVADGL